MTPISSPTRHHRGRRMRERLDLPRRITMFAAAEDVVYLVTFDVEDLNP